MEGLTQAQIEKTGTPFEDAGILLARKKTWEAVELIASRFHSGMTEEEGQRIANDTLAELGSTKKWHRSWVRFGVNTLKQYGIPSEPGVVLGENDLFFIDIGPVWDGYEGDCGKTFTVGSDEEMARCSSDAKNLWDVVRDRWERLRESGEVLYQFAVEAAREKGWTLTLHEANGHRLSDFPHAIHFKGAIADLPFTPSPARWVLEIQIRHPERAFGAFYEDLLV